MVLPSGWSRTWPHCICNSLLELWKFDTACWVALQLKPAETKGGSVGFAYINKELKIKLWALIRNLCLGFILLLPAHPFSFPAPLSGIPSSPWLLDSYTCEPGAMFIALCEPGTVYSSMWARACVHSSMWARAMHIVMCVVEYIYHCMLCVFLM